MNKIGLFYSFNSPTTAAAATAIAKAFGEKNIDLINAETVTEEQFLSYDFLILGVPTWWDGELPNYWDEFLPALEDMDLKGKTIALFGHGDQKGYAQNFADAIGILAEILKNRGARITGETPLKGYTFERSKAVKGNKLTGLVLDEVNQQELSEERIKNWVKTLKTVFKPGK